MFVSLHTSSHARTKSHVWSDDVMCEFVYIGAANCAWPRVAVCARMCTEGVRQDWQWLEVEMSLKRRLREEE